VKKIKETGNYYYEILKILNLIVVGNKTIGTYKPWNFIIK